MTDENKEIETEANVGLKKTTYILFLFFIVFCILFLYFLINLLGYKYDIYSFSSKYKNLDFNSYLSIGNMNISRGGHTSILLKNGNVVITGGGVGIELLDMKLGKFKIINKKLPKENFYPSNSIILNDTEILLPHLLLFDINTNKISKIDDNSDELSSFYYKINKDYILVLSKHRYESQDVVKKRFYNINTKSFEKINISFPDIIFPNESLKIININNDNIFAGVEKIDNESIYILGVEQINENKTIPKAYIYNTNKSDFVEINAPSMLRMQPKILKLSGGKLFIIAADQECTDNMTPEIYDSLTNQYRKGKTTQSMFFKYPMERNAPSIIELADKNILICGGNISASSATKLKKCLIYKMEK